MKRILFVSLVAAALLVGAGCEKIIEFDGEQTQPRLTVSAQAEAGDSLLVYVASSIFFLTDQRGGDTFRTQVPDAHHAGHGGGYGA